MNNRSFVTTTIAAAILVVIVPLLAVAAAVCASFGIDVSGGLPVGLFGTMGFTHVVMLVWTIAAIAIVATLVALLASDRHGQA
jgi:hypothetical protein